MSKRKDEDLILDILESINRIITYTKKISYEKFLDDFKSQDAVIRNLEVLGEAAKLISSDIKKKFNQIPWKDITGTRDRLIHDYFGVNIDIVWDIVKNELPQLVSIFKEISESF